MIRDLRDDEFDTALEIINEAAQVYRGVIPDDMWHDPYMSAEYLRSEMDAVVRFICTEASGRVLGVMGTQDVREVSLIRHAYVRGEAQRTGIGRELLARAHKVSRRPTLVGTWADARWAIDFYRNSGFTLVPEDRIASLLRAYWDISPRQVETSVVLADDLAMLFVV